MVAELIKGYDVYWIKYRIVAGSGADTGGDVPCFQWWDINEQDTIIQMGTKTQHGVVWRSIAWCSTAQYSTLQWNIAVLTCAVLGGVGEETKNVLYQPVLVCDDVLADPRGDGVDYYHGVGLQVVDAVHGYRQC